MFRQNIETPSYLNTTENHEMNYSYNVILIYLEFYDMLITDIVTNIYRIEKKMTLFFLIFNDNEKLMQTIDGTPLC